MRGARSQVLRASRCTIPVGRNPGAWSQVPHPRCQILGVRFSGARFSCARLKVADPRCQILSARLQVPDSRCQSPGVRSVRMAFPKLLGTHSEVIRSVIENDQFIFILGLLESVTSLFLKYWNQLKTSGYFLENACINIGEH